MSAAVEITIDRPTLAHLRSRRLKQRRSPLLDRLRQARGDQPLKMQLTHAEAAALSMLAGETARTAARDPGIAPDHAADVQRRMSLLQDDLAAAAAAAEATSDVRGAADAALAAWSAHLVDIAAALAAGDSTGTAALAAEARQAAHAAARQAAAGTPAPAAIADRAAALAAAELVAAIQPPPA